VCVCFRSGDEFLRDVRPDRTNRAFLILLLLFYARALHILLCLNYTAIIGRMRCGPSYIGTLPTLQDLRAPDTFYSTHILSMNVVCTDYSKVQKSKQCCV